MTIRNLAVGMVAALVATAGTAHADTAAGWDFSQYYADGLTLQDPGAAAPATVKANYSTFDPTNGAGAEANAIGEATLAGGVLPAAGSLEANKSGAVVNFGDLDYDSHGILLSEGQVSKNYMSLSVGASAGTVVFEVDLGGAGISNKGDWEVSFGGNSVGGTSQVDVDFSTDCASWVNYGTANLDENPATSDVFSLALDPTSSSVGCVRLSLDPSSGTGGRPYVDNVTVSVPEPGASVGLLAGFASLLALQWRRARS